MFEVLCLTFSAASFIHTTILLILECNKNKSSAEDKNKNEVN